MLNPTAGKGKPKIFSRPTCWLAQQVKQMQRHPLNIDTEHNHSHKKYHFRQFTHNLHVYVDYLEVSPAAWSLKLKSPKANLAAVKQKEGKR